jgi:hypothetical protein
MKNIVLFFLALYVFTTNIFAQLEGPDSKGREFWLTFLPNLHRGLASNIPQIRNSDSLHIFIVAEKPTTGVIKYKNINNVEFTRNFTITNPAEIFQFSVVYRDFELNGFNETTDLNFVGNQHERIAKQAFNITSVEEVTVYAINQAITTSDAFLVLPVDILDNEYYIMSYDSDGSFDPRSGTESINSTPSQFAVVATEDNTTITIRPTASTVRNKLNVNSVTLDRGDVYLVQTDIRDNLRGDLTGTNIQSTKPIAVFSGHQRARLPIENDELNSRDILIEQLPPVETWGFSAFITPYPAPSDGSNQGSDLFRVLAAYDNTIVMVDSLEVAILDKGEFYQANIPATPKRVDASSPVLVAQFKKTSGDGGARLRLGDPFMMLVPPAEQFMKSYRFINVQVGEYEETGFGTGFNYKPLVYEDQYVTIVSPSLYTDRVRFDNNLLTPGEFRQIPNTTYSYVNKKISDGVHTVESDTICGIYVYGYGEANSYGYVGGMNFKKIDFRAPQIFSDVDCGTFTGSILDTGENDTKIEQVFFDDASSINVSKQYQFIRPDSSVFAGRLLNPYQDGIVVLTAIDSSRLRNRQSIDVPGFTLNTTVVATDPPKEIEEQIVVTKKYCFDVRIFNYGKFPQKIDGIAFKNASPQLSYADTVLPDSIAPGTSVTLKICFQAFQEMEVIDSLILINRCVNRTVAGFQIFVREDKIPPRITKIDNRCDTIFTISMLDDTPADIGLESYRILDSLLINVTIDTIVNDFPDGIQFRVRLTDTKKDAIFAFEAIDSASNITTRIDTIKGYTIAFTGKDTLHTINYGERTIYSVFCDTLYFLNEGNYDIEYDYFHLKHNILYSIPQYQMPFVLKPFEKRALIICFAPLAENPRLTPEWTDSLLFGFRCYQHVIPLRGIGVPFVQSSNTRCDVPLIITSQKYPVSTELKTYPNPPTGSNVTVEFSLPTFDNITVSLSNALGEVISVPIEGSLQGGEYTFELPTSQLPKGVYFIQLKTTNQKVSSIISIVQ